MFDIIPRMTGMEYEKLCARQLERLGYKNVRMTPASHDQGIDLIAEYRGSTCGFQCKYYSTPVGNDAVQQAYAGRTYYGLDQAFVLTNTSFTASARRLAIETGVELWEDFLPQEKSRASLILRIPAAIIFIATVYAFLSALAKTPVSQSELTILAFALFSSLSLVLFAHALGWLVFSSLCAAVFIAAALVSGKFTIMAAGFGVLLVLCLIRISVMAKGRRLDALKIERAQLADLIAETREQYVQEIQAHLEDQLLRPVKIQEWKAAKGGTMVLRCTCTADVRADLAICEFALNREAEYEHSDLRFQIESETPRSFKVTVYKKRDNHA